MIITRDQAEAARLLMEIAQPLGAFDADHVNTMFKLRAIQVHPDKGGTMEAFVAMDRAKHVLLEWLKRVPTDRPAHTPEVCENCTGTGALKVQRGFRALRMQCPSCYGSGEKGYERDKVFD